MKKILLLLYLFSFIAYSQSSTQDAWLYFENKPKAETFLGNPISMLSQRALERRKRQDIPVDEKDVPIDLEYYIKIKNTKGITILAKSKWLNAIHIQGTYENIDQLKSENFVSHIEFADKSLNTSRVTLKRKNKISDLSKKLEIEEQYAYGDARNQIEMLGGEKLHQLGYTGEDMVIAVIDAGFPNVNTLDAFAHLRENNKILGGYNFVANSDNFYNGGSHGTMVLSDISGNISNQFIGTAPNASFYLFITEDGNQEMPIEESHWVEAAERADSLGVDIINTSLGYTEYDNPNYSYTYEDMDGKTAFASRGAEIAFSRGMILVTSAGNSGNGEWKYIGVPADAKSVFSIGAVDPDRNIASFSSYGPTADGRIKPDVCAEGRNVYIINPQGEIKKSNGTSFSSPVLCGVVACLWEAYPEKTNAEIIQMLRESAHLYETPNNHEGYGIPNIEKILTAYEVTNTNILKMYPNPVQDVLQVKFKTSSEFLKIKIYDVLGRKVLQTEIPSSLKKINVESLSSGTYIIQVQDEKNKISQKIIKE